MKRLENLVVEVGKVSNELVAAMARKNKIHVLPIAAKDNKDRPVNDEEVTSLWLSGSSLTVHCLKDFVGLKNLSAIHARGLGGGKQWIDLARLPSVKTLDVDFSPTAGLFTAFVKEGVLHKLPNAGNEVGSGLKAVASDEQIRWLVLPIDGPITKEVMTSITSLKKLESLSLRGTQTTDEGLKILTALTELKALDLSQTQVTNACFKEVSKFKHLTDLKVDHLDLNDSALAAAEYSRLHLLPGLFREDGKTRAKSDDEIVVCVWPAADGTNQSLKALAGCSHLTELQIQGEGLTDEGVDNIAALKHLVKLTLMQTALTDAGLTHLTKSKNLRVLELHDGVFTEAGLEKLDKFDNLTTLKLDGLPVSANCLQKWNLKNVTDLTILGTEMNDSVLNEIARWEQLKSLTISGNAATPEGVKKLTALSNLKTLRIYNLNDPETCFELRAKWSQLELLDGVLPPSYLTDDGITKLVNDGTLRLLPFATRLDGTRPQSLEAIEVIKLENVNITAQGVKALVKLKNLTRVCLDGVPIGDEGVSELSKLKKLSTLRVPRTRITNASMDGLVGMRELTKLDISNNVGITGKRIHKLSALTNLKYLVLNEIPVGPELMELRKSLPNCKVVFNNPLTGNPWTE